MSEMKPLLEMKGICKTFPGVKALSNVNFRLYRGEVHGLMGENGAGKSTLIKVLTGVYKLDEGEILLDGIRVEATSPQHAQMMGISTVYQEINLCPNLTVAENIFIGREPMKHGRIDWKEMNKRAELVLGRLNIYIDVTRLLSTYSIAVQQMVAIARAVDISAKVLILDEPTSSLDAAETEQLFKVMRKLKSEGYAIIFVTHFLDQVYEISDRITILRNGELVGEYKTESLPKVELIAKMIGKELAELDYLPGEKKSACGGKERRLLLSARGVGRRGTIAPFDLDIYEGEILGLAGLLGSGRTETARLLFGADRADEGEVELEGKKMSSMTPRSAIGHRIAFCPEDRKEEGIIGDLTVRENIILALQARKGWFRYIGRKEQEEIADKFIKALNISTPGSEQLVKNLSGGNQQKVILARWLATDPKILILDEPTRCIDIGAKAEIQKIILSLCKAGLGILFISSEMDEVLRCSHRIAVLRDRVKIAELTGDEMDEQVIMHTIARGHTS